MKQQYDSYKDSGVEWIGRVPSHWNVVQLKKILSLKGRIGWNGLRSDEFMDESYAYLVTGQDFNGDVIQWNKCYQINKIRYDEDPFIQLNDGDILVTKDGTIGKVAKVIGLDKPACLNSGIFVVKQRNKDFNQGFLYWLLFSPQLSEYNNFTSSGTTILHLYQNVFERMPLVVPPVAEQEAIAAWLDEKCGKIDKVIEGEKRRINLLEELKQSVITEAVTHGLNHDAPLKPSGVDWIGDIPEHWEFSKMKNWIQITNGSDPKLEGDVPVYGSGATSFKTCGEYKEGPTVLIGRKGATLHVPSWIEGRYWNVDTAFDTRVKGNFNLKYFYYIAIIFDYKRFISQTTLPSMTQTDYGNAFIPVPPLAEQHAIVDYLDAKCGAIDSDIAKTKRKIELLQEYEQSLITEAVTGKRKVI